MVDDLYKKAERPIKKRLKEQFKSNLPNKIEDLEKRISALETRFESLEENIIFKRMEEKLKEVKTRLQKYMDEYVIEYEPMITKIRELEQNYKTHRDCITGFQIQLGNIEETIKKGEKELDKLGSEEKTLDEVLPHCKVELPDSWIIPDEEEKEPSESPAEDIRGSGLTEKQLQYKICLRCKWNNSDVGCILHQDEPTTEIWCATKDAYIPRNKEVSDDGKE